jgi:hypothetical protein
VANPLFKAQLVTLDIQGLDKLEKMRAWLDPKTFQKAQRGGVTAAAKSVPKVAGQSISQRYNLKSGRIKQDIRGPFIRGDQATLIFASRAPTLNQYGIKPGTRATGQPGLGRGRGWGKPIKPGRPATATIIKGERQQYPTTFLGRGRSGQILPFRVGGPDRTGGITRTGRRRLVVGYGPSIASIYTKGRFAPLIKAEIEAEINRRFIAGYQRVLDSAARGYGGR